MRIASTVWGEIFRSYWYWRSRSSTPSDELRVRVPGNPDQISDRYLCALILVLDLIKFLKYLFLFTGNELLHYGFSRKVINKWYSTHIKLLINWFHNCVALRYSEKKKNTYSILSVLIPIDLPFLEPSINNLMEYLTTDRSIECGIYLKKIESI